MEVRENFYKFAKVTHNMGRGVRSGREGKAHAGPPSGAKEDTVRLAMWDFEQCDPKRCSGKRLERAGLLKGMKIGGAKFKGIALR